MAAKKRLVFALVAGTRGATYWSKISIPLEIPNAERISPNMYV